jgi:TPR repeat protein
MYEEGRHVPRDFERAVALFSSGCRNGVARGCARLALMFETGQGVDRDPIKARHFYAQACRGGVKAACAKKGKQATESDDEEQCGADE